MPSNFSTPWRPFLAVWRSPVLAAWGVAVLGLQLAARLPFRGVPLAPYAVPLDPSIAFVPLWLLAFGPAGLLGAVGAQAIGDGLDGLPPLATGLRAFGLLLGGIWLIQMGRAWLPRSSADAWNPPRLPALLAVSAPALLTQAAWGAVALEWAGWYPFVYIFSLTALHHLALTTLLGALMLKPSLRALEARFGLWSEISPMPDGVRPARLGRLLTLVVPLILAATAGAFISWVKYGLAPLQPTVLGVHGGLQVPAAVTLLLIVQCLAVFWPDRGDSGPAAAAVPGTPDEPPRRGWRTGHLTGGLFSPDSRD